MTQFCTALRKDGSPCPTPAKGGTPYCIFHSPESKTKQAAGSKKGVETRKAQAVARAQERERMAEINKLSLKEYVEYTAKKHAQEIIDRLIELARSRNDAIALRAITELTDRWLGKPSVSKETSVSESSQVNIPTIEEIKQMVKELEVRNE